MPLQSIKLVPRSGGPKRKRRKTAIKRKDYDIQEENKNLSGNAIQKSSQLKQQYLQNYQSSYTHQNQTDKRKIGPLKNVLGNTTGYLQYFLLTC